MIETQIPVYMREINVKNDTVSQIDTKVDILDREANIEHGDQNFSLEHEKIFDVSI